MQTWLAQKAAGYLSKELNTTVQIKSLHFKLIRSFDLKEIYVEDLNGDTLLYAETIGLTINHLNLKETKLSFNTLLLENATVNLKKQKADNRLNLNFILDYFVKEKDTTKIKNDFYEITVSEFILNNVDFTYLDERKELKDWGFDYNDIGIKNLTISAKDLKIDTNAIKASLRNFSLKEKSGFQITRLSGDLTYSDTEIEIKDLTLITPNSSISNYLAFRFDDIENFNNFNELIRMDGNFTNAKIAIKDIAYFSPALKEVDLILNLTGSIIGTVDNLRARNLLLTTGQATYIEGNFDLKGLPNFEETFMTLDVKRSGTNKRDLVNILSVVAKNNKPLPDFTNYMGNVFFAGKFTGFANDFVANGEFKTDIGRIESDLNMKFNARGIPSYSGTVKVYDLDIGIITNDRKTFGKTSFSGTLRGTGFEYNTLSDVLDVDVAYIEILKYKYSNLKIQGIFDKKLFKGNFSINDRNINMIFDGTVDLNKKLPVFNFKSTIKNANLTALNILPDSTIVSAEMLINFSGNDLGNIQGAIKISDIDLRNEFNAYKIDLVNIEANGIGISRTLELTSDFADAKINGQYDLTTLPSAFKKSIKKYAPSLNLGKLIPHNPQIFDFTFTLKNLEPITEIFIKELKIPNQGSFRGEFNSNELSISLAGNVSKLIYDGVIFDNLIINQESTPELLIANAAFSSITLENGLVINEVTLTNFLSDDEMLFNIKLSDKIATNQLDLYGNLTFEPGNTTLSILPSELLIDKVPWKVEDNFRISFVDERIIIEDFVLRNNGQSLKIAGSLSKDDEDPIILTFDKLDVASFNQLTKNFNIILGGELNGTTEIKSVLGTPKISAKLDLVDLNYNKILIGDVELNSNWNGAKETIEFAILVDNDVTNTINITGEIEPNKKENNLRVDAILNETELILLEPLVAGLVSDLDGKVSANLTVRGSTTQPLFNGSISFRNAALTVDYLQTRYSFTNDVGINNGRISLNNFILTDVKNSIATANGTIDLSNIKNTRLNVNLIATNFQALNTTFRDNELYYGTANATGNFAFNGPLSNMRIDITATTNAGTRFFLPISKLGSIDEKSFITFVTKDSVLKSDVRENILDGLTLNMNLTVTEEAEAQIIFDERVGDIIRGSGNANLQIQITSVGNFEMYGVFDIVSGEYLFTSSGLLNKRFKVEPGGNIRFTGTPYDAQLNISAIYDVRTGLRELYDEANITTTEDELQRRVVAQSRLFMTGTLRNQEYDFDIDFPGDPNLRNNTFGSYFSIKDNTVRQTMGLLIFNKFLSSGVNQSELFSAFGTTGLELVSNQLSNLISNLVGNIDINVRAGRNTQEFGGSARFFNDRLIVNGNIVTTDPNSQFNTNNRNEVAGDLEIEYKFTPSGNFRGKIFNRSNLGRQESLIIENQYTQGVGILYRQDFDNFGEFFKRLLKKKPIEIKSDTTRTDTTRLDQ